MDGWMWGEHVHAIILTVQRIINLQLALSPSHRLPHLIKPDKMTQNVLLETTMGPIVVELYTEHAPKVGKHHCHVPTAEPLQTQTHKTLNQQTPLHKPD